MLGRGLEVVALALALALLFFLDDDLLDAADQEEGVLPRRDQANHVVAEPLHDCGLKADALENFEHVEHVARYGRGKYSSSSCISSLSLD